MSFAEPHGMGQFVFLLVSYASLNRQFSSDEFKRGLCGTVKFQSMLPCTAKFTARLGLS